MRLLTTAVFTVLLVASAGSCGVRPLRSEDLYGGAGGSSASAGHDGGADRPQGDASGGGGQPGSGGAGGQSPLDAAVEQPAADASAADCGQSCGAEQFCDELTNRCLPRTGTGMLSGIVTDTCTTVGQDARVAIAGHRQCSAALKGSYFFSGLPLGRLKLAAVKDGYELYGATVELVPGGVVHDIKLVPLGGCQSPAPTTRCTCTEPSCTPMTP